MKNEIKFFYNGIKVNGKLYKCFYTFCKEGYTLKTEHISVTAWHNHFPNEIKMAFEVRNDTDSMTDYFDTDRFSITYNNGSFWKEVKAAYIQQEEKTIKKLEKRATKTGVKHYDYDLIVRSLNEFKTAF